MIYCSLPMKKKNINKIPDAIDDVMFWYIDKLSNVQHKYTNLCLEMFTAYTPSSFTNITIL